MIENVEIIATQAYDSNLSIEFRELISPHTRIVAEFFGITENQAILLSTLITMNLQSSSIDFSELAHYLDVNCISLAKHLSDIKTLIDLQMVRVTIEENRKRRRQTKLASEEYYVSRELYNAVLKGQRFEPSENKASDVFDLLKIVGEILRNREEHQEDAEVHAEIHSLLNQNEQIQFVRDLKIYNLEDQSLLMFLFMCFFFVDQPDEDLELAKAIYFLMPDIRDNIRIRKLFINQEHPLQKHDLVETEKGNFRNDSNISLTEKAKGLLLGENKEIFNRTKVTPNKQFQIIKTDDIIEKQLFYSEEDQKEIDFIVDTLRPENYQNMMKRLDDENLPAGLCILYFGEAGVSKTQLSYQIAKKTGRDIFNFQLSEVKSMFYGESQKLIKRAFDHYRQMVEKSAIVPIFLMNEADGILSKRSNSSINQGVIQTENAIQTIILNELENLKGILIATTNLQNHFDPSFYRRFLIKKKFEKPSAEVRMKIWADKLPWLAPSDLEVLSKFEITGAIIENVQRKLVLQRALYGVERQNLDQIIKYLEEENVNQPMERSRIGFIK